MEYKKTEITKLSWGSIEVLIGGERRKFRDCKAWPGGAVEWDWTVTGTHHDPGIQPADIHEIVEENVEVLVLSRGQQRRLQIMPETLAYIEKLGIPYHFKETGQAVSLFNELMASGSRPGGIFHSTC